MEIECEYCGNLVNVDLSSSDIKCSICGNVLRIKRCSDDIVHISKNGIVARKDISDGVSPVFKIGEVVTIHNHDHVWHGHIGLICGKRHKFYRIELNGGKTWLPEHWLRHNNDNHELS